MEKTSTKKWDIGKWRRISYYFFLGLVVVAEIGFLVWYLPGVLGEISKNVGKISELSQSVKNNQGALAILAKTDDKVLAERMNKAKAALPDGKQPSGLISGMTALASSSGVAVKVMSFSPGLVSSSSSANLTTGTQVVPVSLTVAGQFSQLIVFLKKLASAQQLLGVGSIDYGQMDASSGYGANIGLALYYLPMRTDVGVLDVRPLSDNQAKLVDSLGTVDIFILPGESH